MPYTITTETGVREYATMPEAIAVRAHGETIAYVASAAETYAWHAREGDRFRDGTYTHTPWHRDGYYDNRSHFAHLSLREPGKIAYTRSAQHGHEDRQTIVSPGKYLTEYFADTFDAETIRRYAARCSATAAALQFARTADEIERVYYRPLGSCMAGENHSFDVSPVRVYGDSDLCVAYTGTLDDPIARAVVWPDRKVWVRVYGHEDVLTTLLRAEGYTQGSIIGARVRRIMDGDEYVMPYVDRVSGGATDTDDGWIKLDGHGPIPTQETSGLVSAHVATCDHCGDGCDRGETLCESCLETTFVCEDCNDRYSDDDGRSDGNGSMYCDHCYARAYFDCAHCGETTSHDDARGTEYGDTYCADCYDARACQCVVNDCCESFVADEDFSQSEQREREHDGMTDTCRACWETYTVCQYCEDQYLEVGEVCTCDERREALAIVRYDPAFAALQAGSTAIAIGGAL